MRSWERSQTDVESTRATRHQPAGVNLGTVDWSELPRCRHDRTVLFSSCSNQIDLGGLTQILNLNHMLHRPVSFGLHRLAHRSLSTARLSDPNVDSNSSLPAPESVLTTFSEPVSYPDFDNHPETYDPDARAERISSQASFGSTRVGVVRLPGALVERVQSVVFSVDNRSTIRTSALSLYSRYRMTSSRDSLSKTVDQLRESFAESHPPESSVKPKLKSAYDHLSTISYAAGAMPSTYGATARVLAETKRRLKSERAASPGSQDWAPSAVLDYGSGTGAAAWAAKEVWPESIIKYYGLEKSSSMIWLSEHLLTKQAPPETLSTPLPWTNNLETHFHRMTIAPVKSRENTQNSAATNRLMKALDQADIDGTAEVELDPLRPRPDWEVDTKNLMAIMSFTLSDLPNADARRQAVLGMWNSGAETMVLVDRGTPAGFEIIADARQQLLMLGRRAIKISHKPQENSEGAIAEVPEPNPNPNPNPNSNSSPTSLLGSWVLAPCPHDGACPLHHSPNPQHFCHFSQRIERPKFLKDTKHTDKPEEDSKFSYVVIRRGKRPDVPTPIPGASPVIDSELLDVREQSKP